MFNEPKVKGKKFLTEKPVIKGDSFLTIQGYSSKTVKFPNGETVTVRNCSSAKIFIDVDVG